MGLITERHKNGQLKWNDKAVNAIFSIVENNQHLRYYEIDKLIGDTVGCSASTAQAQRYRLGITLPKGGRDHWRKHKAKQRLENLHRVAAQRGGKCLSTDYTDSKTPLEWECAEGHRWKSTATTILKGNGGKGSWCKQCWLNNVSSVMRSYRASLPWVNAND
jgi:hypothetical protein